MIWRLTVSNPVLADLGFLDVIMEIDDVVRRPRVAIPEMSYNTVFNLNTCVKRRIGRLRRPNLDRIERRATTVGTGDGESINLHRVGGDVNDLVINLGCYGTFALISSSSVGDFVQADDRSTTSVDTELCAMDLEGLGIDMQTIFRSFD